MHETSERYRCVVELSPDGIVIVHDGRVTFANAAALRLCGLPEHSQIEGATVLDLFHPDSRAMIRERLEHSAPTGSTMPLIEGQIVRQDGTVVEVELSSARLDVAEQSSIQVVMRDVTARKRREAAVRESEERLALAVTGAQEGIWDWNLETGAVFYSPRWKEMLGYSDHEIEPHVRAWERLLHPDDTARAREVHDRVARGDQTYEGEFRLRHKTGHYIVVLSRGFPVRRQSDGQVVRIVGTHFELTERKQAEAALRESEERLTLAFAGAQEGVWDWNLETNGVVYSSRWKQMLGYEDAEIEPHVSAWERLVHPDDRGRADRANDSVAQGDSTYEAEFRLRHKDGHYVHVLSRGFPVRREAGGPVIRIVGTHFDLTERKRAEEMRAEMEERERAERTRTELLGRLVFAQEDERRRIAREMHDQFGEQLTALGLRIRTLRRACDDRPDLREEVDALDAVAQQLDRDVEHLVWKLRPTALDDLGLRAALSNYAQDWSKRVGIPVTLHTSGLLDSRLTSEAETTLYRIAQEALTNIAKHSSAKNVELILERRADHVSLIVEDNGLGFDPSDATAGFGLLGMQERAALVGATLQIESEAGRGTTILVRMAMSRYPAPER